MNSTTSRFGRLTRRWANPYRRRRNIARRTRKEADDSRLKAAGSRVVELPAALATPAASPSGAMPGFIGAGRPGPNSPYTGDLFSEIQRYAALAARDRPRRKRSTSFTPTTG